ncbi:hypothetical protein EJB05_25982, partial [Eragrostis curvula]
MDVKPSNILLASDMNPKITDFDLSVGYLAPEYLADNIISTKNDVYAFGLTLLVTVSCMSRSKPRDHSPDDILLWALKAWEGGRVEELLDPSLFDSSKLMEIKSIVEQTAPPWLRFLRC